MKVAQLFILNIWLDNKNGYNDSPTYVKKDVYVQSSTEGEAIWRSKMVSTEDGY